MPRKPRFFIPDIPVHIVQRGHNRDPVFFDNADYVAYIDWLAEGATRYACRIHSYVLMTNHIHILATPTTDDGISRMMQYLGRRYVPYLNQAYGTSGTAWEGRFRATLVQEDEYLLSCMRYIELNPVQAGMVKRPGQYRWSSYQYNGLGKTDPILVPHPLYHSLGRNVATRTAAYRSLFDLYTKPESLELIRSSYESGTPLGNDSFKEKIEKLFGKSVGQAKRGRPQKMC